MIRDIKIKAVLNGFIVECGCQTLVCEDTDRLTKSINAYFKNPDATEKEWLNNSINSKHVMPQILAAPELTEDPYARPGPRGENMGSGGGCAGAVGAPRR